MRNQPTTMPPFPITTTDPISGLSWDSTNPYNSYLTQSSGQRISTSSVEIRAIRAQHPTRHLTIVSPFVISNSQFMTIDLLAFAASPDTKARASLNASASKEAIIEHGFVPPARRHGGDPGANVEDVRFAIYDYEFRGREYLLYVVLASEGIYQTFKAHFLLSAEKTRITEPSPGELGEGVDEEALALIAEATEWGQESHEEAWVFDRGFWQKDKEMYKSIQKSNWDDVILDKEKKSSIISDVEGFFESEETYKEFSVPWKRGLIFYGPPGNGKTISIKALLHTLSHHESPDVEMLYVKSINSYGGPEFGILQIFTKARQMAPCMLIFEDIDSLVNPMVRSYFLNAVDGLESNHGILMIGSTNHLERLDPGIAKRPSRFDRKYLFDFPNRAERIQYAQYWRKKLSANKKIDFPEVLCEMIADITDNFSFAYMKEAFVATLLVIVANKGEPHLAETPAAKGLPSRQPWPYIVNPLVILDDCVLVGGGGDGDGSEDPDGRKQAEKTRLWKEFQKQVKILRDEMDADSAVVEESGNGDVEAGLQKLSMGSFGM